MSNVLRRIILGIITLAVLFALVLALLRYIHEQQAKNIGETYFGWADNLETLTIDDQTIRYVDQGEGPVVVLLHGVPTSSYMYRFVIDGLVASNHRVIAPDMLGFGASDKPRKLANYNFDAQAERVITLLNSLAIDEYTLVVHDMGGLVGWEMIERDSDRLAGLVITDTILYADGFVKQPKFSSKNPIHRAMFKLYGTSSIGPLIVKNTLTTGMHTTEIYQEEQAAYWIPVISKGQFALLHFFTSLRHLEPGLEENRQRLANLRLDTPIAVLWGERDPFLSVDQVARFAEDIGLHEHWVGTIDVGHFIAEEAPEVLVETISTNVSLRR